jgi:Icc protein
VSSLIRIGSPQIRRPRLTKTVIQLTDLHLFADRTGQLAGIRTWDTFEAILAEVRARYPDFDLLVLTGDLVHDDTLKTYEMLREALGDWSVRCRMIPGNHDDPRLLRQIFAEGFSNAGSSLAFASHCGDWRMIGLDSHVPAQVAGRIGTPQLEWLAACLESQPEVPTLLFVHHPPVSIDVAWLDATRLEAPMGLCALIERSPQVRAVCAGHVHQESEMHIAGTPVYTTPSTCVQFGARAEKSYDPRTAGYRSFTLRPDGFSTEVHRLSHAPR